MRTALLSMLLVFQGCLAFAQLIEGLKMIKEATLDSIEQGYFHYEYHRGGGPKYTLKSRSGQTDLKFKMFNSKGESQELEQYFETGVTHDEGYSHYKKGGSFIFGQYDINQDGKDELVIALQHKKDQGLSINFFELKSGKWTRIGHLHASGIYKTSSPWAILSKNRVRIERNFRQLVYEWVFVDGKFKDVGDH